MGYGLFIGLEWDTLAEQKCLAACKSIKFFRVYILLCTLIDQIEHGHHVCPAYWNRFTKKTSLRTPVSPRCLKVPQRNFKFLRNQPNPHSNDRLAPKLPRQLLGLIH